MEASSMRMNFKSTTGKPWGPSAMASMRPLCTAGMYSLGMRPPTTWLSNASPVPGGAGSIRKICGHTVRAHRFVSRACAQSPGPEEGSPDKPLEALQLLLPPRTPASAGPPRSLGEARPFRRPRAPRFLSPRGGKGWILGHKRGDRAGEPVSIGPAGLGRWRGPKRAWGNPWPQEGSALLGHRGCRRCGLPLVLPGPLPLRPATLPQECARWRGLRKDGQPRCAFP
jgi:hypothetical protein